ncbi:MAG: PEP-CTERM sorting domain-containing protein [Planctomycetaceae bacterium]|nr:PEP-CTERM sorting domain-containing protein [Planctomycetaceae bacterium]
MKNKMKDKIELVFLFSAIVICISGVVSADISSGGASVSSLGNYASEYRVDADQPENTNNCTMNSMEGSQATDSVLEDPNELSYIAAEPFVDDVWDVSNPVENDDPVMPSHPYYPGNYADTSTPTESQSTPEPATILLICAGMCGLLPFTKRNRSKRSVS